MLIPFVYIFKEKNIKCLTQLTSDKEQVKRHFFISRIQLNPDKAPETCSDLTHTTEYTLAAYIRQLSNYKHQSAKLIHFTGRTRTIPLDRTSKKAGLLFKDAEKPFGLYVVSVLNYELSKTKSQKHAALCPENSRFHLGLNLEILKNISFTFFSLFMFSLCVLKPRAW